MSVIQYLFQLHMSWWWCHHWNSQPVTVVHSSLLLVICLGHLQPWTIMLSLRSITQIVNCKYQLLVYYVSVQFTCFLFKQCKNTVKPEGGGMLKWVSWLEFIWQSHSDYEYHVAIVFVHVLRIKLFCMVDISTYIRSNQNTQFFCVMKNKRDIKAYFWKSQCCHDATNQMPFLLLDDNFSIRLALHQKWIPKRKRISVVISVNV